MALLSLAEQQLCAQQGAFGIREKCDGPNCGVAIVLPLTWHGTKGRVYHSRECYAAAEGSKYKVRSKYLNGAVGVVGIIPNLGTDEDRVEQEIMKQVIANPHSRWNTKTLQLLFRGSGTDMEAVRHAVQSLLADQSLYRVGLTMSVMKPIEFRSVQKARKQEERQKEVMRRRRARKRERLRLREEKRAAKEAQKAEAKGAKMKRRKSK